MRYFKTLSIACMSLAFFVASCGDDKPTTPACTPAHFNYASWMPGTTALTLANDVMPIFTGTCALVVSCHGKGATNEPILGDLPGMMTLTAADIKANIVGVNSVEVPSMKLVAAGDPQNSYLMRKVEETNPGCGLACMSATAGGCSTQMPSGGTALTGAQQETIRTWIKQGAN